MVRDKLTVLNRAGIHTRPAAAIARLATSFRSDIFLEKDEMRINAKSIMGIITLGATWKTELGIIADGPDEEEAVTAVRDLFEARFEEK